MPDHNVVAENVFGMMGTICWTIQLIPQVWKSYRSKSTEGFSHWFMLIWGISSIFMGAYSVVQWLNIPLIVQAQLFGFLCFLCWGQCQYYGLKRSRLISITLTISVIGASGVFEYLMVVVIKTRNGAGTPEPGPTTAIGIVASVLMSVALLPQFWEIYKFKEVIGLSMAFLLIDILGGVFNNLSLAFKEKFDVVASINYTSVIVLDGLIVILALVLNPLARRRRAAREVDQELYAQRPTLEVSSGRTR